MSREFEIKEVSASIGMTLNLGNYESFRLDVSCTLKTDKICKDELEYYTLKEAMYAEVWKETKAQLDPKVKAIRDKIKGVE